MKHIQRNSFSIEAWRVHVLIEVGGVLSSLLEYDSACEVAIRLEAIALELKQLYAERDLQKMRDLLMPSTRQEINDLRETLNPLRPQPQTSSTPGNYNPGS